MRWSRWVITVPTTRRIKIHFDEINIRWNQADNVCVGDAVYAYNGIFGQPGATWVAGYCGRGQRADIQEERVEILRIGIGGE